MDIVITTVNGLDPEWQKDYARCIGTDALTKRYRDWGTLPYLLRGIETCMPFIDQVFLVVSRESQVPAWLNRETVRIVLHEEFIPAEYLPTFNSTAIEMFLHRIPGLSEQFIYFNDDFFPLADCKPSDFFRDGKVAISMARHLCTMHNLFRIQTRNSDRLARRAANGPRRPWYVRPQHTCQPMLRSVNEELYHLCEAEILKSVSPLRTDYNYNQYIFTDYAYFTGRSFRHRIGNKHISLSMATPDRLHQAITQPKRCMACINDVEMSESKYEKLRQSILDAFQQRFPNLSKYEVHEAGSADRD